MPGDLSWPSTDIWDRLNDTLDGRLIKTVPIASVCHHPNYDEVKCKHLRENWRRSDLHMDHPTSIMHNIYLKKACDPFTSPDTPCDIGSYVQYTVNVSKPDHVKKAVNFAKEHNLRFVIKNTGHDYMGKSTGIGALSVWMHHLQDMEYIEKYDSPHYSGPSFKLGAGITGAQISRKAKEYGLVVVSGSCSTVGIVGGYIQGGGHSTLSSVYGLAADQALSFEVIAPTGEFLIASPTENSDLYWALSGGGGGTYGIVWSVTVKAFPDTKVTTASISFGIDSAPNEEAFYEGIKAYYASSSRFGTAKLSGFAVHSGERFDLMPLFAYNQSSDDVEEIISPLIDTLGSLGITYTKAVATYPNFVDAFFSTPSLQPEVQEVSAFLLGSRILPASLFPSEISQDQIENEGLDKLMLILKDIANKKGVILDILVKADSTAYANPSEWNAVHPAWRNGLHSLAVAMFFENEEGLEVISRDQDLITYDFVDQLRQLTPGSGAYLNEAAPNEPDFQQTFYGTNYNKLLRIKDKYDPYQMLYGSTSVGGDRWFENESDGRRLCQVTKNSKSKKRSFISSIEL
ncbi:FAD-binding domain-containing protein [Dendrothele bispora CBS 962.96]|uniref:FAD-binding domain-containing protein n=1 Tax=Dendrothele bispora (strain CBS 962.96) TaxID=1314807 RepID=A0A4S8MDU0_DENBC|nr:FAD-binding domain-containing protein [Dendrothele bispora CBS 962.96]